MRRAWLGAGLGLLGLGVVLGRVARGAKRRDAKAGSLGHDRPAATTEKVGVRGDEPLQAVPELDLRRYAGDWYEIARYPNWFERGCVARVKARYEYPRGGTDESRVGVRNWCEQAGGRLKVTEGWARRTQAEAGDGRLKVRFFWPFFGQYWVVALAPDYRWAVVGEPKRRYLWVLARTPRISHAVWTAVEERVRAAGYDPARLVRTVQ